LIAHAARLGRPGRGELAIMVMPPGRAGAMRVTPASSSWPWPHTLLAAYLGAAAVTAVTAASGGTHHPAAGLVAYAVLAVVVAAGARPLVAPAVAVIVWLFDDGFLVGRHAQLAWHGSASAWRLGLLVALAVTARVTAAAARRRAGWACGQHLATGAHLPGEHQAP
jgi:hypothetical protein